MKAEKDSLWRDVSLRWRLHWAAVLLSLLVGLTAFLFIRSYGTYTDEILYEERLSQMQEVTEQLFSALETIIRNMWRNASIQTNRLSAQCPDTLEELLLYMKTEAELNLLQETDTDIIVVDSRGRYYTQHGPRGLLAEMESLAEEPEQVSFVFSAVTNERARMLFLNRLKEPIQVQGENGPIELHYCGVTRDMEELNQYFNCEAYDGQNAVYVLNSRGTKLFTGINGSGFLDSYNLYNSLQKSEYLHGSNFETALERLNEDGISYSNAVLNGRECYYALYQMKQAAWVLLFMVPSDVVAVNTVRLVGSASNLVWLFAVCMIFLCGGSIYCLVRLQKKHEVDAERQNSKRLEQELENSRISVMLSQMQPHFLYNVLNSIYYLCGHDPKLAQDVVVKFSDYLRNNMESLEQKSLISFEEEYRHIGTYLSLEKIRFRQKLEIIEDIQAADFQLPPLSVQPLVENAVKHGVTKKRGGGTVTISTRELEDCFLITVSDTGLGFDPEHYADDGKVHIGIKNVRARLSAMVGGSLTITSAIGEGTEAVVTIPKRRERS